MAVSVPTANLFPLRQSCDGSNPIGTLNVNVAAFHAKLAAAAFPPLPNGAASIIVFLCTSIDNLRIWCSPLMSCLLPERTTEA